MILSSILAGVCIGLGNIMYLMIENKVLGAVIFSCGLLAIRLYKLDLFTGKTQFVFTNQYSLQYYLLILLGNVVGIIGARLVSNIPEEIIVNVVQAKNNSTIVKLLISAIWCGVLMSLATYNGTPLWISSLCVAAFLISGFNHCIANGFYLLDGLNLSKWIITVIGNLLGGALVNGNLCDISKK